MAAELSDIEAKLKAAHDEGVRTGETNAKLSQVLHGLEKVTEQITQLRDMVAPVQAIANRALDASNANAIGLTDVRQDLKTLDRRVDGLDTKIAYAAGAAMIGGAILAYIGQQVLILVVK